VSQPAWEEFDAGTLGTQVVFNWIPPESDRAQWVSWLRRHGINPDDVPVPGWIEVDGARRQVRYLAIVRDENGTALLADRDGLPVPYGQEKERIPAGHHEVATRVAVSQMEAPPLPWPMSAPTHREDFND
jgi:hypothetical protein